MKPGFYKNLPFIEYQMIPAVSNSKLSLFARTPAHARHAMLHPDEPSPAMELGTGMHVGILEPERFSAEYVAAPKFDRRTKEGKAGWAEFQAANLNKTPLMQDEWDAVTGMQHTVRSHPIIQDLLAARGLNELSVVWEMDGVLCKARIDRLTEYMGWGTVLDLKSTKNASAREFSKSIWQYGYHRQAAFYLDGLDAHRPADRRWIFGAVENEAPYCCACYELDARAIEQGRQEYRRLLKMYVECKESGVWPGYEEGLEPIDLPVWARNGE